MIMANGCPRAAPSTTRARSSSAPAMCCTATGAVRWSPSRPTPADVTTSCLTPCSQQTFDLLYPEFHGAPHPSCLQNLSWGLERFGITGDQISTTFNIFMNVWTDASGLLHIDPPTSAAGDHLVLRAEMDLHVGPHRLLGGEVQRGGVQAHQLRGHRRLTWSGRAELVTAQAA